MIPPSRTPVWEAIESIDDLDVREAVDENGQRRVWMIDRRTWTILASFAPADALVLADALREKAQEDTEEPEPVRADPGGGWPRGPST